MAQFLDQTDVFVFHNTTKGSFASSLEFVPGEVIAVEVKIPAGHAGKTGIQIWYDDQQVLPRTSDKYFTGNKTTRRVELDDPFPGGLGWRAEAYNLDKYNHTFYVRFEVDNLVREGVLALPPVLLIRRAV